MGRFLKLGLTWLVIACSAVSLVPVSDGSTVVEIPVEHSVGNGGFVRAGVLVGEISRQGGLMGPLRLTRKKLSSEQEKAFQQLVKEDGNYRIRVPSDPINKDAAYVMATLRTRCLAASGFVESLWLELTEDNRIVGLDYQPGNGRCDPLDPMQGIVGDTAKFPDELIVQYRYPTKEAAISMDGFLAKLEEDGEATVSALEDKPGEQRKTGKKGKKEKTWLQQNWMFVLAGAIITMQVVVNMAGPPEAGPEGGEGGGSGAVAGPSSRGGGRRR